MVNAMEELLQDNVTKCPKCQSSNVYKIGEDPSGEFFICLDCDEEWKRLWDGTVYQMFKCPYCSCVFATKEDLDKHTQYYGNDPELHLRKWKRNHTDIERALS